MKKNPNAVAQVVGVIDGTGSVVAALTQLAIPYFRSQIFVALMCKENGRTAKLRFTLINRLPIHRGSHFDSWRSRRLHEALPSEEDEKRSGNSRDAFGFSLILVVLNFYSRSTTNWSVSSSYQPLTLSVYFLYVYQKSNEIL